MPYATNGGITRADMSSNPSWIPISDVEYQQALDGISAGKIVDISNGFAIKTPDKFIPPVDNTPPEPIVEISNAQGHAILIIKGVYQSVVDYIAAIADPTQKALAEVAFNRTQTWRRDSPFLIQTATDLGFLDNLDSWFDEAVNIIL